MNAKLKLVSVLTLTLVAILIGCTDEAQPAQQKYPFLAIKDVSNVTSSGAVFNGEFDLPGTSAVSDYGFEWTHYEQPDRSPHYRLSLGKDVKKKFSAAITTDLQSGKLYSVRAYAITDDYTVYSNHVGFMSAGSLRPEIFSLSPNHGTVGTEITIVGKNFGHGNPLDEKFIRLAPYDFMNIVSFTDTVIVVKVPPYTWGSYFIDVIGPSGILRMTNVSFTVE